MRLKIRIHAPVTTDEKHVNAVEYASATGLKEEECRAIWVDENAIPGEQKPL